MEVYLTHSVATGGVERQLDGVTLLGEFKQRRVQLVVPAALFGTMNTIYNAQGPRTEPLRMRVQWESGQVSATLLIDDFTRHNDGGATLRLRVTGPVREGPPE